MHTNPYAEKRFLQARRNFDSLIPIMKSGDLDTFIKIVELEALSLHAMMTFIVSLKLFLFVNVQSNCVLIILHPILSLKRL